MCGDYRLSNSRYRQECDDGNIPKRRHATVQHNTAPHNYPPRPSGRQGLSSFTWLQPQDGDLQPDIGAQARQEVLRKLVVKAGMFAFLHRLPQVKIIFNPPYSRKAPQSGLVVYSRMVIASQIPGH